MPKRERIPLSAEFEQLIAAIVAELEPSAEVKWNDHIVGNLSGRNRQIDVSIRRTNPDFLGIIDAKHHARRATIDRIDALTGLMHDVGASYGALVCSSGFSRTIYEYARRVGVSLFNVHDAGSINWSLELKIPIFWTELTPLVRIGALLHLEAGDSIDTRDPRGLRITPDGGRSLLDPIATFEDYWNASDAPRGIGRVHQVLHDQAVQVMVEDAAGETVLRQAREYGFSYVVDSKTWLGRFQPAECRGLVDYLDGEAFIASHLPDSEIPLTRDESWQLIEDTRRLGPTPRGTIVLALAPVILQDGKVDGMTIQYAGPPGARPSNRATQYADGA